MRRRKKAPEPVRPDMSTGHYLAPRPEVADDDGLGDIAPRWGHRRGGAGRLCAVDPGTMYLGATTQVAGLYPFVAGSGSPRDGVPLGHHLLSGETVCFSPTEWLRGGIVTNPGVFVIAQPGVGKSATVKRLLVGMAAQGVIPLILGDIKPDYPDVIRALDGQVITLGRGGATLNPLDPGPMETAARRLDADGHSVAAGEIRTESTSRRMALLVALCALGGGVVGPAERVLLAAVLDAGATSLGHVLEILRDPPAEVLADVTADDCRRVRQIIGTLSVGALVGVFADETSVPVDLDAPGLELDISPISMGGDATAIAAAMLAVWAASLGTVAASIALAEVGLAPRRNYVAVLDEAWRALRGSPELVDSIDALTRVSRSLSMAQIMVTHSLRDLEALADPAAKAKARGLVERCGTSILGAVSPAEAEALADVLGLSHQERGLLADWRGHASWDTGGAHPGRGKFLIKTGGRLGLPVQVDLLPQELALYDTDAVA